MEERPAGVKLKPRARLELARRYRLRAQAEAELVAYLSGIADALGIDPRTVVGFDDDSGELLVEPEKET